MRAATNSRRVTTADRATRRAAATSLRPATGAGRPGSAGPHGAHRVVETAQHRTTATLVSIGRRVSSLDSSYVQIFVITLLLVAFGLVMVLSSSTVEEFRAGNPLSSKFLKQAFCAVVGLAVMVFASRRSVEFWKRMAWVMLGVAVLGQLLVFTPMGYSVGDNRAWISVAGFTMQPAEMAKVALIVWLGLIFERKHSRFREVKEFLVPLVPMLGISVGLILLGQDLGTTMVIGALVLAAMWFGSVPGRYIGGSIALAVLGVIVVALTSRSRVERMTSFFTGTCDYQELCWQTTHGLYALSAGGFFGVGLGGSKAKWSWLPEADNDFIFAIVGEELGLFGAIVVLSIFCALLLALLKLTISQRDIFSRTVCGALLGWLTFQTFVNIAVVLGILPVLGVPLPFLSSGGSALITTLLAVGIVLSLARDRQPSRRHKPSER